MSLSVFCGDVAQLGEHHVRNVGVVGSNPIISTTTSLIFYALELRKHFYSHTFYRWITLIVTDTGSNA